MHLTRRMLTRMASPTRRAIGTASLAAALAAAPLSGAAQDPQGQDPVDSSQTFRLRIDSISVDVIVLDRDGNPVRDLTPADFEVREAGTLQQIEAFKFIDVDESAARRPIAHRDILSFEDQRREAARDDTRLLVILLDDYHVRRGNSLRIREQLAFFVRQLQPNDLVAVTYPLAATTGLTFSRNHDATARAIMAFEGRKYDYTPKNAFEERYMLQPPEVQERMRNDTTIRAVESIAAYMGGLREGRKSLLFISEGLSGTLPPGVNTSGAMPFAPIGQGTAGALDERSAFFNSVEVMNQLRYAFAAANRSNTSVYTLDPRGLAASEFDVADNVSSGIDRQVLAESLDTLRTLAAETGGRAIVNRNDPLPDLYQMVEDNSAYYLIGYTTSEAPRDGKFHEIQVRVNRPGVQVRARKGYWAYTEEEAERATAPAKPEAPPDVDRALEMLATTAGPTGYRAVRAWLGATPRVGGGPVDVTFAWESTPETAAGRPAGRVDRVSIVAEGDGGRVVFRGVAPHTEDRLVPAGRVSFPAPAGPLRVKVVAEDAAGEPIDVDDLVFDVADYGEGPLTVAPPMVFRGRTARDIQSIRSSELPVPTPSREFSRTERLLLRFGVFGDGSDGSELAMRLLNSQGETMAPLAAPTRNPQGQFEAVVPLSPFPPGDFLIEIAATSGDATARALIAVRVTG